MTNTSAIVLCGGRSTRMGRDKATLPFHGEALLSRVVRIVTPLVDEVVVVARPGQELPALPDGVVVTYDEIADSGPLAGIVAGLRAAHGELCFVTACDAPLLEPALVRLLFERARAWDAAAPFAEGHPNPLLAVYRRSVLPVAEALIEAGRMRPFFILEAVRTLMVTEEEVRSADVKLRSFLDCDTPEAYAAALAAAALAVVTVELFDVARARAGTAACTVRAATVGDAVARAAEACPGLVPDVVEGGVLSPHFRVNLRGEQFIDDPATPLRDGDHILVLSAQAGG